MNDRLMHGLTRPILKDDPVCGEMKTSEILMPQWSIADPGPSWVGDSLRLTQKSLIMLTQSNEISGVMD